MSNPKQVSTTENSYGFFTPPDWKEKDDFAAWRPEGDPTRAYQFARQRNDIKNNYNNPLGAYTTPEMREQMTKSALEENGQAEGQSALAEQSALNEQRGQQLGNLAQLGAPKMAQTKGTTTQQQKGGFWGNLLSSGIQAGLGAAASFA